MATRSKVCSQMILGFCLSFLLTVTGLPSHFIPALMPAVNATPVAPIAVPNLTDTVQKTVLENGLTVLTKEVHTAPVVSVQVWYRVGSRNETIGINGISHQLEHLMFKGTQARPIQFGRLFSAIGSESNAFTSYDETAYYGTVRRDQLNALLTLEADRMVNALITPDHLASEKRVVISELQGYENSPDYRLEKAVMQAAFPNHPYGLPIGGTRADVEQFTLAQVRQYYQTYYRPDNATLVITGDFDTTAALEQVQQTFGQIPRPAQPLQPNPAIAPVGPSVPLHPAAPTPIVLQEPGSTALLQVVYPLPNIQHSDIPAIEVMDMILTGGRSSRLDQALVETGLASEVGAYAAEMIEPGWYSIVATAVPGQSVSDLNIQLQQALADLRQQGVTPAEVDRAKTQLQAWLILNNQDITSQANQLGYSQTIVGDYRYSDRNLAAIAQVTPADVQRVAQTYLAPGRQTLGFFNPTLAENPLSGAPASSERTAEDFNPSEPIDPAEVAQYLPPATENPTPLSQPLPKTLTLSNGLRVLLLEDHSTPTVNLSGWIEAGSAFDSVAQAGLASLTAENLMNGTVTQDALTLAQTLEDRGASLDFQVNREGVKMTAEAVAPHLPTVMQTLADVLQHATFPSDQLELSRQRALTDLKLALDDPQQLARRTFLQTLYSENHPFHGLPTEDSLQRITRDDLVQFYQRHYRPDATILALVGDFDAATVRSQLESALGHWQTQGQEPHLRFPRVQWPPTTVRLHKIMPGKAEAVTLLGYDGITRQDPRFYAALVLNQILGGDTLASRLGTEVRDRQGLTYGIYSYFQAGRYSGPFVIAMQTDPKDVERAINSTVGLLQQLQTEGVTSAEVNAAQQSLTQIYPVELASPSSLAATILANAIYGLEPEEIRQFPEKVAAVTLEQVQQAINDLIHPDRLVIVTAGPASRADAN